MTILMFSWTKGISPASLFLLVLMKDFGRAVGWLPQQGPLKAPVCWINHPCLCGASPVQAASSCRRSPLSSPVSKGWWGRRGLLPLAASSTSSTPTMVVVRKARNNARRKENVAGNLFVDESCINCDTCRWMQGDVFVHEGGKSAVARQPETEEEKRSAYRAMIACPTASIRLETADPVARDAVRDFPFPVDSERLPGVFHLGFHDENSFGCSPWLVQRQEGNLMMDSPRFHPALAKALDDKGGVSLMVMSHIDDVGDHQRWKERFPEMKRVMHKADIQSYGDTRNVEVQLDGDSADGQIGGFDFWDLGEGLRAVHTPGHSKGSITLLYSNKISSSRGGGDSDGNERELENEHEPSARGEEEEAAEAEAEEDETVAFTGDHLALSGYTGALTGFPRYGYDLEMQSTSLELLARPDVKFRWVLPGHGRMTRFDSHQDRTSQIMAAAAKTKAGRT